MTIDEIIEQEQGEFDRIVYEEGLRFEDQTEITESDVCGSDEARDYSTTNDEDGRTLYILVQPERQIRYIHVGAPAPQYAINSINRILSCMAHVAIKMGIYAREEGDRRDIEKDIILETETTEEQVAELMEKTKEYMIDEEYTGVDCSDSWLTYDAGRAEAGISEPTRNW